MTRIGNIGSLPRQLRPEPNSRLENGGQSLAIICWLNALRHLQSRLNSHFKERSIMNPILSEWKTGSSLNVGAAGRRPVTPSPISLKPPTLPSSPRNPPAQPLPVQFRPTQSK